ncbi:hypothetical protein SNE35_24865 [Paucibacter sp. R3-3]|uniref:Uncharacterized protein n=1 Tax=Roseateles agri TaxID=3098619 RepID=A0ABU5DNP4_9BURK|nr:hypothetical protein [Paucibacter sp. R3-3]MDY0747759.1 hypothetical protein [Paucibacter sp. R3-3]
MQELRSIEQLISGGLLAAATEELLLRLEQAPADKELIRVSSNLSARLRSRCMNLACNKATDGSLEAIELEDLLRRVIAFNGEGIYG